VPDLQIVILRENAHKPIEKHAALFICYTIDTLCVLTDGKDRLPSRHWIGPDNGVIRSE